jgi:hypothetical protein
MSIKHRAIMKWIEVEKSRKNKDKWHTDFYPVVWPSGLGFHSTPFKWSNDQLEYHGSLYLKFIPLWGISTL